MVKNMNKQKAICILGGMGPQASARFLVDIVDMAAREFGVRRNDDFPEIIVDSVLVPDFIADEKAKDIAFKILSTRVRQLDPLASTFAICCNTAHIMFDDLQASTKIPFISVIDEVAREVEKAKIKKVGLLATPTTVRSGLYQAALGRFGVKVVIPSRNDLVLLESVIRRVLAGLTNTNDVKVLVSVIQSLRRRGAHGVILGCTELLLVFPKNFSLPVFDSIDILVRALLRRFFRKEVM